MINYSKKIKKAWKDGEEASQFLDDIKDYLEPGTKEIFELDVETGWGGRIQMPGYMDATDWTGVYETAEEVEDELESMYADEDYEGEE